MIGYILGAILVLGSAAWIATNRQNFVPLTRREFSAYFLSPIAYLVLAGFLLVATWNYWNLLTILNIMSLRRMDFSGMNDPILQFVCHNLWFWISLMVCVPIITMRLLSEEKGTGTIEVLMTAPVSETQVVLSKFAGCMIFYMVMWLPSLGFMLALRWHAGLTYQLGPMLAVFLGIFTMGCMFVAMGVFFSSLTKNQIVAAILTFAFILLVFGIFMVHSFAEAKSGYDSWLPVLKFLSVFLHLREMGMGRIDVRHLVFHLSMAALMLFLTVKMVEARKWK